MTIRIVVAPLRATHFIARSQEGNALGEHQRREHISLDSFAKAANRRCRCAALCPPIATVIFRGAVAIVLTIGKVVLAFVTHEVMQSEPIVASDEIDAG